MSSSPFPAPVSRRNFTRLLALGATSPWLAPRLLAGAPTAPLGPAGNAPDEPYWHSVRARFVMPPDISVLNAANLCPSSAPVLESLYECTRSFDRDPSFDNRAAIAAGKETTRTLLAEFLRVTPEEIILARNTSEANNMVSLGLDLRKGDEVVVFGDNHPCNKLAWEKRAERHGFTVVEIPIIAPHPGAEAYLSALRRTITPRTRLIAFSHLTNTVGDLFPANEICALARAEGILTLVDGAQTFGLLDLDLGKMSPDFYTGSAHKWPCGPKEAGLLYVNQRAQGRLWPSIVSSGTGAVGISATHEGFGQRDEPALVAFGEALKFQQSIGRAAIEARSRSLAQALMAGLGELDGVELYTDPNPQHSVAVVVFRPGQLDPKALAHALYRNDRIGCTARTGERPGLRISPHFYNLPSEIDRTVAAIAKYLKQGLG